MTGRRAFLLEVTEDPTRFFSEIAGHMSMGDGSVEEKIAGLEDQGVLKGYEFDVDPDSVGDGEFVAVVGFRSTDSHFEDMCGEIEDREEVIEVVRDEEGRSVLLEASFRDADHLHEFTTHFDEEQGVHQVSPAVILRRV